MSRAEVSQATGMLAAQLRSSWPRPGAVAGAAFATGRSATNVACDLLDRQLRLQAVMRAHLMLESGSVAYRTVTRAEWSRS